MNKASRDAATEEVRDFYDGPADAIYRLTWGENLHLGIRRQDDESRQRAMEHTTERMTVELQLDENAHVLDLGSGYGGPARQLASQHGCQVTGLNLSQVENELAWRKTRELKLEGRVRFVRGDFHELPFPSEVFDVVWSQDSFMYGADKNLVLSEAFRVLKPGGFLNFTDILVRRTLESDLKKRLYARVRTPEMWDSSRYVEALLRLGFTVQRVEDWSDHVESSYAAARDETITRREELIDILGEELVAQTLEGLAFWIDRARRRDVGWAFFVARKPK